MQLNMKTKALLATLLVAVITLVFAHVWKLSLPTRTETSTKLLDIIVNIATTLAAGILPALLAARPQAASVDGKGEQQGIQPNASASSGGETGLSLPALAVISACVLFLAFITLRRQQIEPPPPLTDGGSGQPIRVVTADAQLIEIPVRSDFGTFRVVSINSVPHNGLNRVRLDIKKENCLGIEVPYGKGKATLHRTCLIQRDISTQFCRIPESGNDCSPSTVAAPGPK